MRVLLNGMQAGNQSGTGRYTEELIRHLTLLDGGASLTVWWPENVAPGPWAAAVDLVRRPRGLVNRLRLEREIQRARPDYDVVHYPANIGPLNGGPNVVVTVHDCTYFRHPEWFRWERARYYRWAGRRSARRAARIIADSTATQRDIQEFMGIPSDHVDVVPLGVGEAFSPRPAEECRAARIRYGLPEDYLLYVGTLEPRKNLARLVRAWDQVAATVPGTLVLAGREGWKTGPLHAAIAAAAHRDRIHLPGYIAPDDLPALLSGARAFVWPSLYEGFGLPVLEAMACGTPVLTTDGSSLPEVTGHAALLVPPEDEAALAGGLQRLAGDGDLRRTLAAAGVRRAATFTWMRCAEATRAVYARVAREAAAAGSRCAPN